MPRSFMKLSLGSRQVHTIDAYRSAYLTLLTVEMLLTPYDRDHRKKEIPKDIFTERTALPSEGLGTSQLTDNSTTSDYLTASLQ